MPNGTTAPGKTNPGAAVPMSGSTYCAGSGGATVVAARAVPSPKTAVATAAVSATRRLGTSLHRVGQAELGVEDVVAEAAVQHERLFVLADTGVGLRAAAG